MRVGICCAVALGLAGAGARAAEPGIQVAGGPPVIVHGPMAVAKSIITAELAFNARSEAVGPALAMREFMDPVDGLSFTGGEPARGAAAIFQAHGGDRKAGALSWVPAEVFASAGGDMGATWGHFTFTPPAGGHVVTGKYVTVWRKRDGAWKGVLDIGNPD
jgi:hypothetical protein